MRMSDYDSISRFMQRVTPKGPDEERELIRLMGMLRASSGVEYTQNYEHSSR